MNEITVRKLKNKFIFAAMMSFISVMLFMSLLIFVANLIVTRLEIGMVLDFLIEQNGIISENEEYEDAYRYQNESQRPEEFFFGMKREYESPEFPFMVRYFAVVFEGDGRVRDVKLYHVTSIDRDQALEYAITAKNQPAVFGRRGNYHYKWKQRSDGTTIVVFIDSASQMRINNRLLQLAFYLMMVGVLISFLLLKKISGRVVRAEVRNIELQNSFMTNASHELKTPLAVIRANTEVLEMTQGENEWTSSTMRQVDRMDGLIKNLVMITKAQEQDTKENRKDVDVSAVAEETAGNFKALAMQEEKELSLEITKGIHMKAMEGQIRQLVSILLDNAIKYCDEKGKITVSLKKKGRQIHLDVSNSYAAGEGVDCLRFFDRFYREDESHNVERGGYGIGLSIAESIVRGYNGSIEASFYRGIITFSCRL